MSHQYESLWGYTTKKKSKGITAAMKRLVVPIRNSGSIATMERYSASVNLAETL